MCSWQQTDFVLAEAGGLVPGQASVSLTVDPPEPTERDGEGHRFQDVTLLLKYADLKESKGSVYLLPKSFQMELGI